MSPDISPAPPEAEVIRIARLAADMTAQDAAEASRAHDGRGVSASYWRDVERGRGGRRGKAVPVRASERALAVMARVVGVTPAELTAVGREDAARVLESALRRDGVIAPAPRPGSAPRPSLDFSAIDPALRPFVATVLKDVYARIGFPPGAGPGRELPDPPEDAGRLPGSILFGDEGESEVWDDPRILTVGEKVRTIALMRKITAEWSEKRRKTG